MAITEKLICLLDRRGVDFIELGVPFSDPIADGPTIQYSSNIALSKNKVNLDKIFSMVKSVRRKTQIPLILMSYYNPVLKYGIKKFMAESKHLGINGLIIPDIIPEEGKQVEKLAKQSGISLIYLLAPTTTPSRRKIIYSHSSGFIYIVSVTGVTGARSSYNPALKSFLSQIRKETKLPLMLGFGISEPKQARMYSKYVNGFIIGSAVINIIRNTKNYSKLENKLSEFIGGFTDAGKKI